MCWLLNTTCNFYLIILSPHPTHPSLHSSTFPPFCTGFCNIVYTTLIALLPSFIHPPPLPAVGTKVMQKARVKEVLLDDFGDPEGKEASSNLRLSQENCQRCSCVLQTVLCTTKKALKSHQILFLMRGSDLRIRLTNN